jgi:hypothetical protein
MSSKKAIEYARNSYKFPPILGHFLWKKKYNGKEMKIWKQSIQMPLQLNW